MGEKEGKVANKRKVENKQSRIEVQHRERIKEGGGEIQNNREEDS